MKNFMILTESINFIEDNLCEPFTRQDIADRCHVSLSSLEKLFRYALECSIKDYVTRRRMTQAAKDISQGGLSVTEAALKYQYNSVEVFSRVFRRVWNESPSEFKGARRFTGIFPKINFEYREGDDLYMMRKRVDLGEAYDFFRSRAGRWVLCFDGVNFADFNKVSYRAGDLAILEIAARIESAASDDMVLMRIGGDEFALVTDFDDETAARAVADEILAKNGEPVMFEGRALPLSLWCGMARVPEHPRYAELFTAMHAAVEESKK